MNGRWESNAKKAAAMLARRKSMRLGAVFKKVGARQASVQAKALKEATLRVKELREANGDPAALFGIISDLQQLPVTAKLLQRTALPKLLLTSVASHPEVKKAALGLCSRWRDSFRQEMAQQKETAELPSVVVARTASSRRSRRQAVAKKRAASTSSSESSSSSSGSSSGDTSKTESLKGSKISNDATRQRPDLKTSGTSVAQAVGGAQSDAGGLKKRGNISGRQQRISTWIKMARL